MATEYDVEIAELVKAGKKSVPLTAIENEIASLKLSAASLQDSISSRKEKLKSIEPDDRLGHLETLRDETNRLSEIKKRIEQLSPKPQPKP